MRRALAALPLLALLGCRTPMGPPFAGPHEFTRVSGRELVEQVRALPAEVVVVNVWATWCAPCVEEMPGFIRLARTYRARGVALALVSTDPEETEADALEQLSEWGAPSPTYLKTGKDTPFIEALHPDWNGTLPATFVFRGGARVAFWEGTVDYDTLEARVLAALEPNR